MTGLSFIIRLLSYLSGSGPAKKQSDYIMVTTTCTHTVADFILGLQHINTTHWAKDTVTLRASICAGSYSPRIDRFHFSTSASRVCISVSPVVPFDPILSSPYQDYLEQAKSIDIQY